MRSSIFRSTALERLSSPEQLDTLMQVTDSRSWLAFLALAGLITAALYWSMVGVMPLQVDAPAVLHHTGGIKNLVATDTGQIVKLYVTAGDAVAADQLLAEIDTGNGTVVPVYSLHTGQILEVRSNIGDVIERGASLASLESTGAGIGVEATLYLDPRASQAVAVGMPVQIVPQTGSAANQALQGTVTAVSDIPVSRSSILSRLGNHEFIASLVTSDTPIEVRIAIDADQAAGYDIQSGTLGAASILVGEQRPIELIIPWQ